MTSSRPEFGICMSRTDPHHHNIPGQQPLGRVAILGLGLIGGSLGQVLCAVGAAEEVNGWDISTETMSAVSASGAISNVAVSAQKAVADADLVVLCVPVDQVIPMLGDISPALSPNAVVTDVAGTKSRIVIEGERILGGRFLGGHPMAGSEESGFAASSVDLFDAAVWLITPTPNTNASAVELVSRMADWCGASIRACTPDMHDIIVGHLSQLPHLIAFGLASTAAKMVPPELVDAAAGSFKGATRVALSDPCQWTQLLLDNRILAAEALSQFQLWAESAAKALRSGDGPALHALLAEAHKARMRFPR
jgi:prephenate dehydrogenase